MISTTVHSQTVNVPVPSDPKASYQIVVKQLNGKKLVIGKRTGPSGVSFTIREVHCDTMRFRYLAEGDTVDEMMKNINDRNPMSSLFTGSISYYIVKAACR